jgi:hypothetical protein
MSRNFREAFSTRSSSSANSNTSNRLADEEGRIMASQFKYW